MIAGRYLQLSHIPLHRANGRYYADELWHRDVLGHLSYIEHFVLLCPCKVAAPPVGWRQLDAGNLSIVEVSPSQSLASELVKLPRRAFTVWRQVGLADIVHSSIAGWPLPTAWLAVPIARLRRKFTIIIVESAPWAAVGQGSAKLRHRVRDWVFERLARYCVSNCDLPIFTHDGYRKRYLGSDRRARVAPASWISKEWVLDEETVVRRWRARHPDAGTPLRLAFYGRLVQEKGIMFLLESLAQPNAADLRVELDIWGDGALADACANILAQLPTGICVRLRGVLPYGAEFRRSIGAYDAVIIPSFSDEQPRIIYDAFAQGVPCLASGTLGHGQVITNNETGFLIPNGDMEAWIGAIRWCVSNRPALAEMGRRALAVAQRSTHEAMHAEREQMIIEAVSAVSKGDNAGTTANRCGS